MNDKNKRRKKYLSAALAPKSISILLVFSFIVTVLAFAVAYSEHQKMTILSQKYDEAMIKINNCEEVLGALVKQMEISSDSEVILPPAEEESQTEMPTVSEESDFTPTEESLSVTKNETAATKADTTQKGTEESATTTKAPSTSGPYFVTQSGKKYHVGSCSYLSKSKIPISADKIKSGGYSPCSRCIK